MALVRVSHREISLEVPLAFPVYSVAGKLLLRKGHVIRTPSQLERLFAVGPFREDPSRDSSLSNSGRAPVVISTAGQTTVAVNLSLR